MLVLKLKKGNNVNFVGFREADLKQVQDFSAKAFGKQVGVRPLSVSGFNWGDAKLEGKVLKFESEGQSIFDVLLQDVGQVQIQGKSDVQLEFHTDDTAMDTDSLVEMSFYVPPTNPTFKAEAEEGGEEGEAATEIMSAAENFRSQLLSLADVTAASAGDAIATFDNVAILTPRGRFEVGMHFGFLMLQGQSQDFKIQYSSIMRIFILPKPNIPQTLVIVSLDPPIRKGQTFYPHIMVQMPTDEEVEIELAIDAANLNQVNEKHNGKLEAKMGGLSVDVFARILRGLSGAKVTKPGQFRSTTEQHAVRCSYKADDGYLFPLEKAFFYVHKPPTLILHDEISSVEFQRQGNSIHMGSASTFDLVFRLKSGQDYQFRGLQRGEYSNLLHFMTAKKLRIENFGEPDQLQTALGASSEDEEMENEDEDSEEDEDFNADAAELSDDDDDDEPEDGAEDEDVPVPKKKKKTGDDD